MFEIVLKGDEIIQGGGDWFCWWAGGQNCGTGYHAGIYDGGIYNNGLIGGGVIGGGVIGGGVIGGYHPP